MLNCTGANEGTDCTAANQVCIGSMCVDSCPVGTAACTSGCIDPDTDPQFCGADPIAPGPTGGACDDSTANDENGEDCTSINPTDSTGFCNAGICDFVCNAGLLECSGSCVNPQIDANNCGGCSVAGSNTCTEAAIDSAVATAREVSAASCNSGTCQITCDSTTRASCDGDAYNGCEVDLTSDASNCGACGNICASGNCLNGECVLATCGNNTVNGSEACDGSDLDGLTDCTDLGYASGSLACDNNCLSYDISSCVGPITSCADDELRCGTTCVDPTTNTNCGTCGRTCNTGMGAQIASASCGTTGCVIQCNSGFGNCDGNPFNGCEVDLNSTAANCGLCGTSCGGSDDCRNGECVPNNCGNGTAAGSEDCDTSDLDGADCQDFGFATAAGLACTNDCKYDVSGCGGGSIVCAANELLCGSTCTNPTTDDDNCGACGRVCTVAGIDTTAGGAGQGNVTGAACGANGCVPTCAAGFEDCDGNPFNGCEADLSATATCGSCTNSCGGSDDCRNGQCVPNDCGNGTAASGEACDSSDGSDPFNGAACGDFGFTGGSLACTNDCVLDISGCTGSATTCPAGEIDCSGTCRNPLTNTSHCGGCSISCGTAASVNVDTRTCEMGSCGYDEMAGSHSGCSSATRLDCDGVEVNGCEVDITSASTCGNDCTDIVDCANLPNAGITPACTSNDCALTDNSTTDCTLGWGNCNMDGADGCETFVNGDPGNCGGCGTTCLAPTGGIAYCVGGGCGFVCSGGLAVADPSTDCTSTEDCSNLACPGESCTMPSDCVSNSCTAMTCD